MLFRGETRGVGEIIRLFFSPFVWRSQTELDEIPPQIRVSEASKKYIRTKCSRSRRWFARPCSNSPNIRSAHLTSLRVLTPAPRVSGGFAMQSHPIRVSIACLPRPLVVRRHPVDGCQTKPADSVGRHGAWVFRSLTANMPGLRASLRPSLINCPWVLCGNAMVGGEQTGADTVRT